MKRLLIFCFLLYPFFIKAQEKVFVGHVLDESKKAVAYINVVLISKTDSSFIQGVVTDESGAFRIETKRPTEQLLKCSGIGYQTSFSELKNGDIFLSAAFYDVGEITISGKRPVYRMKGSSFMTDVSNSLLQDIGSANDVLKQLPGVIGDNGEFKVFGKGKATIYINDRLVRDASELDRLSSKDIASVELINNPGASYDADVRAILKIKTNKKIEGFASRLRMRGRLNHRFSDLEQLNLSYTTQRLNWYGVISRSGLQGEVDGRNRITVNTPDTLYRLSMDMMDWKQSSQYYTLESGVGIYINPNHEVGTSYAYQFSKDIYEGDDFESLLANDVLVDKLSNYSSSNNKYNQHAVNLYYIGKVADKLGVNLNIDYINRNSKDLGIVTESGLNDNRVVSSRNNSRYNLYATKLVLSYPLWNGQLEGGVDFSIMDYNQEYVNVESFFPEGWFNSDEKKIAGFVNYSNRLGILEWNAGLRYERFHARYYEDKSVTPTVERIYKELYPTVSLSLPVKKVRLSLVYSKRTARPSFYQLRNAIEYTSRFIYSQGNPYLRSSQLHDVSLNAGYRFLQMSLGYYRTKDWICMTDKLLPNDPLSIVLSHKNVPKYQGMSAMLTFQHKIGFWSPTWTAAVYKNYLDMRDYRTEKRILDNPYGYFTFNNMLSLGKGFILNVDGSYTTAGADGETSMKPTGALDVDLQFWDVFKSSKRRMTIYTEHVDYYRWNYNDARTVRLTLTYNFNKYKKKYKGVNSAEDEIGRM